MFRIIALALVLSLLAPAWALANGVDPHSTSRGAAALMSDDADVGAMDRGTNSNEKTTRGEVVDVQVSGLPGLEGTDTETLPTTYNTSSDGYADDYGNSSDTSIGLAVNPRWTNKGSRGTGPIATPTGTSQPADPVNPVPEPATALLVTFGIGAVAMMNRRRNESASH